MTKSLRTLTIIALILSTFSSIAAAQTSTGECPATQFVDFGSVGIVTPGEANNLRAEPSDSAEAIGTIEPGEPFNVIPSLDGGVCADGYLWQEVQTLSQHGWTVEAAVGGDAPFIVPYEQPEPLVVGEVAEDGSITVEESGVSFTVPAGLNIAEVRVTPRVGFFGEVMSAQPSSVAFELVNGAGEVAGIIQIVPFGISDETRAYMTDTQLETLLTDEPSLLEYAAANPMPQYPLGGVAALFGGAGTYLPFGSGDGLRYITFFAQSSVIFVPDSVFSYQYRGITEDEAYIVVGTDFAITAPASAIPAEVDPGDGSAYTPYLREVEANFSGLATSDFTPDLALIDALFASLTITDNDALFELIP